jgi:hypothetical protein
MLDRIRFAPLLCLAACGVQNTTSGIEGAMKAYVPGLQLDTPVSRAHPRYRLAVAPELGPLVVYSDTAYRHASGMRGLLVATDQILLDSTQRPSPEAHVRSIALSTVDATVAHQVEQDLRGRLGEPRAWCMHPGPAGNSGCCTGAERRIRRSRSPSQTEHGGPRATRREGCWTSKGARGSRSRQSPRTPRSSSPGRVRRATFLGERPTDKSLTRRPQKELKSHRENLLRFSLWLCVSV